MNLVFWFIVLLAIATIWGVWSKGFESLGNSILQFFSNIYKDDEVNKNE